jgi:hypothetical protein
MSARPPLNKLTFQRYPGLRMDMWVLVREPPEFGYKDKGSV